MVISFLQNFVLVLIKMTSSFHRRYVDNSKNPQNIIIDPRFHSGQDKTPQPPVVIESDSENEESEEKKDFDESEPTQEQIEENIANKNYLTMAALVLLFFLILTLFANITTIVLASLTIENGNNVADIYNEINKNIMLNNINNDDSCLTCAPSGDIDDSYISTITGVMNNDLTSLATGFTQFSPNGIELDNILFSTESVSSANSNTNILFENNYGASSNLYASVPGYITIPQSTMPFTQIVSYCASITGPQVMFANYYNSNYKLCICSGVVPSCINLV